MSSIVGAGPFCVLTKNPAVTVLKSCPASCNIKSSDVHMTQKHAVIVISLLRRDGSLQWLLRGNIFESLETPLAALQWGGQHGWEDALSAGRRVDTSLI